MPNHQNKQSNANNAPNKSGGAFDDKNQEKRGMGKGHDKENEHPKTGKSREGQHKRS